MTSGPSMNPNPQQSGSQSPEHTPAPVNEPGSASRGGWSLSDAALYDEVSYQLKGRVVGKDARIFFGLDIGYVPPLPSSIVDILQRPLECSGSRESIAKHACLAFIPSEIGGVPTSINSLRDFAQRVSRDPAPIFRTSNDWYSTSAFASETLKRGLWVLGLEVDRPFITNCNDEAQQAAAQKLTGLRTAFAIEQIGLMALYAMEHGKRILNQGDVRCETRMDSGEEARVVVGHFAEDGGRLAGPEGGGMLLSRSYRDSDCYSNLGRALVCNLD